MDSSANPPEHVPQHRDDDLLAWWSAGERERAFTALVQRYQHHVFRLCCALLREPDLAREAAQESFLRAWRAFAGYDPQVGAVSTWLYAIARNRCLSLLAGSGAAARRANLSLSDEVVEQRVAQRAAPESVPHDSVALLRRLVEELAEPYRRTLLLYYYEDHSVADVAQQLGVPENTVKTHLARARARLLERLRELGLGEASDWLKELAGAGDE